MENKDIRKVSVESGWLFVRYQQADQEKIESSYLDG